MFLHNPHRRISSSSNRTGGRLSTSNSASDINLLTIGQHITSLTSGKLDLSAEGDVLLVGSQTNLLAYNVERNADLFYKEVRGHCSKQTTCVPIAYTLHTSVVSLSSKVKELRFEFVQGTEE